MSHKGDFPISYCALEYSAHDDEAAPPNIEKVILIATRLTTGELSIRVHPDWRETANSADHVYLQALFDDLGERANLDPEGLLTQLSSLNVGPLRTFTAGQMLANHPDLLQLFDHFQEI